MQKARRIIRCLLTERRVLQGSYLRLGSKEIEEIILADEQTQKQLQGRTPKKVIVVPENNQYCRLVIDLLGYLAAILTTTAFVPQAYKIWKTKSAQGSL